jgi:Ser/Thr protein kinase RdoA (MazF antagonist)
MRDFNTLTNRGRARRLRQLALVALAQYPLEVARVRLITNEFNGIFRVDTPDDKYVLRVCRAAQTEGGRDQLWSEMAWLAALREEPSLEVPEPVATRDGELVVTAHVDGVPEPRHCAVFSWLPGRDLDAQLTPENVAQLGALAARLHRQAASWEPPAGFSIVRYNRVLPAFEEALLFDPEFADVLPPERRDVFMAAAARVEEAINRLQASGEPMRVIHGDLHRWNVKVFRGRLSPFDFEDLIWGWPVQDIAISLYYFHGEPEYATLRAAFRQGYETVAPWPERYEGEIDRFIAGRSLVLANGLLQDPDLEWQAEVPRYFQRTEARLRALAAGTGFELRYW